MSIKHNIEESLSALMDSEVDDLELRRILKSLPDEPGLEQQWQNYHLISASLKQEVHSRPAVNLLPGIKARLAQEKSSFNEAEDTLSHSNYAQAYVPKGNRSNINKSVVNRVFSFIGQGAIAASAVLAVFLAANLLTPSQSSGPDLATNGDINNTLLTEPNVFDASALPEFRSSELRRTVSFEGNEVSDDDAAKAHLSRAVYRAFVKGYAPLDK